MKRYLTTFAIMLFNLMTFAFEGGYADKITVFKGESVKFYISTAITPYNIEIFKLENNYSLVETIRNLNGSDLPLQDSTYSKGAGWPVSHTFTVPENWQPGTYRVQFPISDGGKKGFFIFVKERNPGTYSKTLFILSNNTWEAYNNVGGKSLYDYQSTDNKNSDKVTFMRPSLSRYGYARFSRDEEPFIRWTFQNNINIEYASQYDIHSNPDILKNYDIIFIVGHNEYWSLPERQGVESFIANGGKVMILSGNTCYWQVRYENNGQTIICYKNAEDPLYNVDNSQVTMRWSYPPINNSEAKFLGVNWVMGGYVNNSRHLPDSLGYTDYGALNTHHWSFDHTGIKDGDEFGKIGKVVGIEVDGTEFYWENGFPKLTGAYGTPSNFRILGISPAKTDIANGPLEEGTMGIYHNTNGGAVFNSATINWSSGILIDQQISQITLNVYNKFKEGIFPPEVTSWNGGRIQYRETNNDSLFIVKRIALLPSSENTNLSVQAEDPLNKQISYSWVLDNNEISSSSSVSISPVSTNRHTKILTTYVYNDVDTTTLHWLLIKQNEFFINSVPKMFANKNSAFTDDITVESNLSGPVSYTLVEGPSWLSIDNSGKLSANIGNDSGIYNVLIRAEQGGMSDEMKYKLNVGTFTTSVDNGIDKPVISYNLGQNYPNPFNPSTTISYSIPVRNNVTIKIFDAIGNEIAEVLNETKDAGNYTIALDLTKNNLASGVYFYSIKAGDFLETKKMIFIK